MAKKTGGKSTKDDAAMDFLRIRRALGEGAEEEEEEEYEGKPKKVKEPS